MVRAAGFEPRSPAYATTEPRRHSTGVVHFRMPGYLYRVKVNKLSIYDVGFVNRHPVSLSEGKDYHLLPCRSLCDRRT